MYNIIIKRFASDSIVVGKDCDLYFPSVLGLISKGDSTLIKLSSGTNMKGIIFLFNDGSKMGNHIIHIEASAKVTGHFILLIS